MKIVCSASMPFAKEAFERLGPTVVLPDGEITAKNVRDAEILAVRSTVKVGRDLLEGSRVRFVGTATIGFDHFDTDYLDRRGIVWRAAPGCNANSVSEYLVCALLHLAERRSFRLAGLKIGVVGAGNVGSLVALKAPALGMTAMLNDPPRQRMARTLTGRENRPEFLTLDAVLAEADIVTMHVPLSNSGPDATLHMAGREFFGRMKPGCVFVNSARGRVAVTADLIEAMEKGTVKHAIIDTWDPEPAFPAELLERVEIGTPHIAGHSFEGKVAGTVMVYREACRFLGATPEWTPDSLMPAPPTPEIRLDAAGRSAQSAAWEAARRVYDITADDQALRKCKAAGPDARAARFAALRKNYPVRREFRFTKVMLQNPEPGVAACLSALGFATGE